MRSHVRDTGGLSSSPGSRHGHRRGHSIRRTTSDEAPANLAGRVELSSRKSTSASDGITWTVACRNLRFKQDQNSVGAVCRPPSYDTAIGFTQ
jgi:hypothetical protein